MAGGGTGDSSTSTGGTTGGVPGTGFGGSSTLPGQMPLYQTAQTPFSGYRPAPMGGQFFQPIYRPEYQNYSNPMTAFNVSSYGTSPVPSAAYMRAMTPGGIGLPGLYQNIQNYAANYMATPGASFGRLLGDMGYQGVSPMDMQMAYGGFGRGLGRFSPFFGGRFGQGYSQGYGSGFSGGFGGGVPSMTTPFSRPFVPEAYMFSQYPQGPMGSMGQPLMFGSGTGTGTGTGTGASSSTPGRLIYGPTAADPTQRAIPTQAQFAAQQSIIRDPQAAALAAARQGLASGLTNQQIADQVNQQYGKSFSAQNVADFIAANQAALNPPTGSTSTSSTSSTSSSSTGSTDPTQQAVPNAAQLAQQQSIVANPQQAALGAVQAGLNMGLSPQQIADQVNAQYGKSFSTQNVIDFIAANKLAAQGRGTDGTTQQKASGGILSLARRR